MLCGNGLSQHKSCVHNSPMLSLRRVHDLETIQQRLDASPFGPWWGLLVESGSDGISRVRLPHRRELQRLGGALHGGCAVVVADVAVWVALMTVVEGGEDALTVHLTTEYLAAARGDIIGTARLIKVGRQLAVGVAEVCTDDGKIVSAHQVTYALPRKTG